MKEIILCYQGEMVLKGLNKASFESTLAKILRYRVKSCGNFKVYRAQSTMYIEPLDEFADVDEAYRRVSKVFGLAALSRAVVCDKNFETSILPYEDCCTIVTPPHPKTKPSVEEILEAEAAMPGLA